MLRHSQTAVVSVGQGRLEARGDGGDCHVDTTKAPGTERLKSCPNCDLASKPGSHLSGHPQAVAHLSQPFYIRVCNTDIFVCNKCISRTSKCGFKYYAGKIFSCLERFNSAKVNV